MASLIEKHLHLDVVSFCYDWGLRDFLVNGNNSSSEYKLGFGLGLAGAAFCGLGWFWIDMYLLSSIKLPRTAPLVLGILESDNHRDNLSFRQQPEYI